MVKVRAVVRVTSPALPEIVIGYVPVLAVLETVSVKCEVPAPGATMEAGLKVLVTPDGTPVAERATAELNPPETVVVTTAYPLCPSARYPAVGETEMVNAGVAGEVTVRETVVVSVNPPPVPVTVIG
jgi:hypothetical protein